MGLFGLNKKKEKKKEVTKKASKEDFEIGSDGLIFDAKFQYITNSRAYAKEVSSSTIEHIKNGLDIKQRKKYYILSSQISKIEKLTKEEKADLGDEQKSNDVFRVLVELRLGVSNKLSLFDFCFNYLPFFIEVIEPMSVVFSANDLTEYATNIQGTIHNIDAKLKTNKLQYDSLLAKYNELAAKFNNIVKSADRLLRNNVILTLKEKSRNIEELSKLVGVPIEQLKIFVDKMTEDKELKLEKNKYSLAK